MSRALLVVDVQNEYDRDGALPIAHPPFDDAVRNVDRAISVARDAGIPVVVVRQTEAADSPAFAEGGAGWQLHPAVARHAGAAAHVVDKRLPSAFAGTDLDGWLRGRGVATVTVVGFMTQNCVASTALDALHRGYAVEVLADATGTVALANGAGKLSAEELHTATLVVLQSRFAAVAETEAWAAALRGGPALERPGLLASAAAAR